MSREVKSEPPVVPLTEAFEQAFTLVQVLAKDFEANKIHFLSPSYQESEVRKDFIDKLLIALGWDVNHDRQKNPFEQEVKVERGVSVHGSQRRADYAFYVAPNFRDVRFFVEAKKPFGDIATSQNCFQIVRYGWNSQTPVAILTDFEQFHIMDCRYKPNIDSALTQCIRKFHYSDYTNIDAFAFIFYMFSRDAVANGSIEKFTATLPTKRGKAVQRGLVKGGYQGIDEAFLEDLDEYRDILARAFKNNNATLDGETLTELTQRTIDRLVFMRFIEDKGIYPDNLVGHFGDKGTAWQDFVATSRRLDSIYNGIVFKRHDILDASSFKIDDDAFAGICKKLAHINSPYDFNSIPIHILGSIYEQFLGKVIVTTDKRARLEEKPEVRKAGGVYYTPEYIVRYIVDNTVGKLIKGKSPAQIENMRFADIACGSGSFLLGIFDAVLLYHTKWFNDNPEKAKKAGCVLGDDGAWHLSLNQRRHILVNNIYGVDIDNQAVEVAQLSLYLKLLQEETTASARQDQLEFRETLLPSLNKNIVCGNSLIGTDVSAGQLFARDEERKLNPMDFEQRFPEIMKLGGFDVIVGNPPYLYSAGQDQKAYFERRFETSEYQTDFYVYFVERATKLLKRRGLLGMIVSDSWLKGKYFTKLRHFLLGQTSLFNVTVFDYCPFKEAAIENSVILLCRDNPEAHFAVTMFYEPIAVKEINTLKVADCITRGFIDVQHSDANLSVIKKIEAHATQLSGYCRINRGVHAYRTDGYGQSKFCRGSQTKRDKDEQSYHAKNKLDKTYFPEIKGKHLERYSYNWDGTFISYGQWLAESRSPEYFFSPKLAIRKIIAPKLICTFMADDVVLDQSVYVAIKTGNEPPQLLFLLGILSSSISGWYLQKKYSIYDTLYPWFTKEQLASFPIVIIDFSKSSDKARYDKMVELVVQILATKKQLASSKSDADKDFYGNKCGAIDRQIDDLVYELYGLTPGEIDIVEGTTAAKCTEPTP
jgi:type I restriction-modification system DNA methylase subunit